VGAIILGVISDKCNARRSPIALTSIICSTIISLSFLVLYEQYPHGLWLTAMFFFGFFIGSMHHLICITVSADLGRSHSKRATSTITGIIDGMGTVGSGMGQLMLGILIENFGWRYGYFLPITCAIGLTLIPIIKIFVKEKNEIKPLN
jgi:sugar phosphate permease